MKFQNITANCTSSSQCSVGTSNLIILIYLNQNLCPTCPVPWQILQPAMPTHLLRVTLSWFRIFKKNPGNNMVCLLPVFLLRCLHEVLRPGQKNRICAKVGDGIMQNFTCTKTDDRMLPREASIWGRSMTNSHSQLLRNTSKKSLL